MSKRSIALRSAPGTSVEVVEPAGAETSFVSFSYSVTEVTHSGGRTHVKARSKRLADGKLVSESFDGELDGGAYERLSTQAAEQLAQQLRSMWQPFGWLLPRHRGQDR